MPDRDEVIKDAEHSIAMLGDLEEPTPWCDFIRVSFKNALTLLREQDTMEPVKPKETYDLYECGACGWPLCWAPGLVKYCARCGRRVKWDADGA